MTRPILIKNAEVFAPEKLGRRDIFIASTSRAAAVKAAGRAAAPSSSSPSSSRPA